MDLQKSQSVVTPYGKLTGVKGVEALVTALLLTGLVSACGGPSEPATADFCHTVASIPSGSSVQQAQESFARIEDDSPQDIRATVTQLRTAIDQAQSEHELDSMDAPGSPVRAATLKFQSYVTTHCGDLTSQGSPEPGS
ncbi:MAG TPA: hypothetical protein VFM08_05445 [Nocardioides sp.]|nr:hypothetical protein [Nocardioides sp.]